MVFPLIGCLEVQKHEKQKIYQTGRDIGFNMLKHRKLKNRPERSHWRSTKKWIRNLGKELQQKGYFEDCNYAPCKVTELNMFRLTHAGIYSCDVMGEDLFKGGGSCCSLIHCNATPLTEKEAFERRDYWQEHGEVAYQHKYVYPHLALDQVQAQHDEFVRNWR